MFIFWEAVILGQEGGKEMKEKKKKMRYEEYEAKI